MTPAISVIMPVRNGAEWLAEAVASVRAQDFGDFEFLIVDDGSDDGTAAMLAGLAAADPRIRLLRQAPQGIVAALNNAIAEARAPYLARLDADDRARPDRLGKQLAFMEAHPFMHSALIMRAALVRQNGGYRAGFRAAEDYDLWLRMAPSGSNTKLSSN